MTSGALAQFFASPTDLVKVQMQMEGRKMLIEARPSRFYIYIFKYILKRILAAFTPFVKQNFLTRIECSEFPRVCTQSYNTLGMMARLKVFL